MSRFIIVVIMVVVLFGCLVGAASAEGQHVVTETHPCQVAGIAHLCFYVGGVKATHGVHAFRTANVHDGIVTEVTMPGWWFWERGSLTQDGSVIPFDLGWE